MFLESFEPIKIDIFPLKHTKHWGETNHHAVLVFCQNISVKYSQSLNGECPVPLCANTAVGSPVLISKVEQPAVRSHIFVTQSLILVSALAQQLFRSIPQSFWWHIFLKSEQTLSERCSYAVQMSH